MVSFLASHRDSWDARGPLVCSGAGGRVSMHTASTFGTLFQMIKVHIIVGRAATPRTAAPCN